MEYFIILIVAMVLLAKLAQLHRPPREKLLVTLRARGREAGLRVELVSDPLAGAGVAPAVRYLLPWPLNFDTGAGFTPWSLVRDARRGKETPWVGWRWADAPAPEGVRAGLEGILAGLPSDVGVVQCDRSGLSIYWGEQGGQDSVAKLVEGLNNLRNKYIKQ